MNNKLKRRDFFNIVNKVLIATGLSAILGPAVAYFYPPFLEETPSEPVRVGTPEELPNGESIVVPFGRYPALVLNISDEFRAYSAVCTHFSCIVKLDADKGMIECPCHEGFFDPLDGSVISGPPPTALIALHVEIVDGYIYVSVGEES